jgi:hypothetical protein
MTITQVHMGWGSFTIPLRESLPGSISRVLDNGWYSLIRVYPQRIQGGQVDSAPGAFTGVLLDRNDRFTIGGASATWYLGESSDGVEQTGPMTLDTISKNGTSNGALGGWLDTILDDFGTGLTAGFVGGPDSSVKKKGGFRRKTPKTILDTWICPKFGVVYRVNPDLTLDIGYQSELWPVPDAIPLAVRRGGRSLAVDGLTDVELSLAQSTRDRLFRVTSITDWSYLDSDDKRVERTTLQTAYATWTYKNPLGDTLPLTLVKQGPSSEATTTEDAEEDAMSDAELELNQRDFTSREVSISTREFNVTARVEPGSTIWVWDVDDGLFNLNNPIVYQGQYIYPVALRVNEVTWPVTDGMSVWYDNRHNGGSLIDLTSHVDFEDSESTISVGAPPLSMGRAIRRGGRR